MPKKTKAMLEAELAELQAAQAKPDAKPAQTTRTVKLPKSIILKDARVMVGVDPTYTNNLAVWACDKDGQALTKTTGELKKPKRVSRAAMLAMLAAGDDIRKLCEFDTTA